MSGRVIGVWGRADASGALEAAVPRILAAEIGRRLPGVRVDLRSPSGRPAASDGGAPSGPVEQADAGVPAVLAGDVLGPAGAVLLQHAAGRVAAWWCMGIEGEQTAPAAPPPPAAVATLRDAPTAAWLGATAPPVAGEPLLLAPRLLGADAAERRRALLRLLGALPADAVAVEAGAAVPDPPGGPLLLLHDSAAGEASALDLAAGLPGAVVMPPATGVDDLVAALGACRQAVVRSAPMLALAAALRLPVRLSGADSRAAALAADLGLVPGATPAVVAEDVLASRVRRLDAAIDALVEALVPSADAPPARPREPLGEAERAAAVLSQRLVGERTAFEAELARLEATLERFRALPPYRWFEGLRAARRRLRRR